MTNTKRFCLLASSLPLVAGIVAAFAGGAVPPLVEDFEETDGYQVGPLEDRPEWKATGEVEVTDGAAFSGMQSLLLLPHSPASEIRRDFGSFAGGDITFVDFFLLPSVNHEQAQGTAVDLGNVRLRYVARDLGARLEFLAPSDEWHDAGFQVPLNESGQVPEWVRLTVRLDYGTRKWDLYFENSLVLFDRDFVGELHEHLHYVSITGHAIAATLFDYLYVGGENPVFENTARDGIADYFKSEHSLPLDENVRDWLFTDGARVIEKFHAESSDSDIAPSRRAWLPFFEDFENRRLGSIHAQGGWVASSDTVALIQQEAAFRGTHALRLAAGVDGALYHDFLSDHLEVWVDMKMLPVFRTMPGMPEVPDVATSVFFFDGSGSVVFFDGTDGQWKPALSGRPIAPGAWASITIRNDYGSQSWSIWVNSILAAENVGFARPAESFSRLHLAQALQAETLVDEISITLDEPDHLDDDGDGLPNQFEGEVGSDPRNRDTSGDGMWDGLKILWELNPAGPSDIAKLASKEGAREFSESFSGADFTPGALSGQRGWDGSTEATIAAAADQDPQRSSVAAASSQLAAHKMTRFVETLEEDSVWTTADMRFVPGPLPKVEEIDDPSAALLAADRFGYLHAFDGATGHWVVVDDRGYDPDAWRRVDIELNYATKRWRLCLDGQLVDGAFGFQDRSLQAMSRIQVRGATGSSDLDAEVQAVRISTVEPGDLDFSGDGMTNAEKRARGLNIYSKDTDDDGMPDWWEIKHGLDPLDLFDARRDANGDGFRNLLAYLADMDPSSLDHLVQPWETVRVGPGILGAAYRIEDGIRMVAGNGSILLGSRDRLFFMHKQVSGDFNLVARVRDPAGARADRMLGLMARSSLAQESAATAVLLRGDEHYWTASRPADGDPAVTHPRAKANLPNAWMKIERRGERFLQFASEDGILWRPMGVTTLEMPETIFVGFAAVCTRVPYDYMITDVDHVSLETVDDADWLAADSTGAAVFNSFAWVGEWDGLGDPRSAALSLRRPVLEELHAAGFSTRAVTEVQASGTVSAAGEWRTRPGDSSLASPGRRGWVEYELEIAEPDSYLVEIEGREGNRFRESSAFDLKLYLEGEYLGTRVLEAGYEMPGKVYAFTPWLAAGRHRLRILWDGAQSRTHLRLDAVRLRTIDAVDSSGNGIKDWVEDRLIRQSGLDPHAPLLTYVSPLPVEGRDKFKSLMGVERQALLTESDQQHRDVDRLFTQHPRGEPGLDLRPSRDSLLADLAAATIGAAPHFLPTGPAEWNDYLQAWSLPQRVEVNAGPGHRFWTAIPLAPLVDNAISIRWQRGVAEERLFARWVPYNLISGGEMTIRAGDSLLLTAHNGNQESGQATINVDGEAFETVPAAPLAYTFSNPGQYVLTGSYRGSDGTSSSGSLHLSVQGFSFAKRPIAHVGRYRDWNAGEDIGGAPLFEADPNLNLHTSGEDGHLLRVGSQDNVLQTIAARVVSTGAILDSVEVENFRLFSSWETYLEEVELLPDGSRLVEMMVILSPVPRDVEVRLDIVVGGVLFDDGTLQRVLHPQDFDEVGQATVRFIMPKEAVTSICHRTSIYQDGALISVR